MLADLYLVAGRPAEPDRRFAFGYGVFLQLLDDLQDVEADLAAGHQTLFTRAAARGVLDEPAARLARFVDRVLDAEALADEEAAERRDLVRRNCRDAARLGGRGAAAALQPALPPLDRAAVAVHARGDAAAARARRAAVRRPARHAAATRRGRARSSTRRCAPRRRRPPRRD